MYNRFSEIFYFHFIDEAKRYVQLFSELDRLPQLQTYYNNCHKVQLNIFNHSSGWVGFTNLFNIFSTQKNFERLPCVGRDLSKERND